MPTNGPDIYTWERTIEHNLLFLQTTQNFHLGVEHLNKNQKQSKRNFLLSLEGLDPRAPRIFSNPSIGPWLARAIIEVVEAPATTE